METPIEKKKVVSSPINTRNEAEALKPLALARLSAALKEDGVSVSELLRILTLPQEEETDDLPLTLPDGWKLYHER